MPRELSFCPVCYEQTVFGDMQCGCQDTPDGDRKKQCDMCKLWFPPVEVELGICEMCQDTYDEILYGYSGPDLEPDPPETWDDAVS